MPSDALPDAEGPGGGRLVDNILYFGRALRAAGLPVGPGRVIEAVKAVEVAGVTNRRDFYWTLHAVFVNRRDRSEEHTSELQSLMRNSYAVFCLKKKQNTIQKLTESTQYNDRNKRKK